MKQHVALLVLLIVASLPVARAQSGSDSARTGPVVFPVTTNAPSEDPAVNPPSQSVPPDTSQMTPSANASSSAGALSPQMPGSSVNGSAANAGADDIYDIRPPFFYLYSLFWLWIALAALVLIGLLVLLWIRFKPLRALHPKSDYDLALEKLEKAKALLDDENPEPYAVAVSETVRSYLGQRFQASSSRRTTEEFLSQMQADTDTPLAEHRDLLRGFLEACDLVKFAHYQPGRDELEQVQQRALTFVTATKPVEQNGSRT